jgi:hypothetical protein
MPAHSTRTIHRFARLFRRAGSTAQWVLAVAVLVGLFTMHTMGSLALAAPASGHSAAASYEDGPESAGLHASAHAHPGTHATCPVSAEHGQHEGPCPDGHGHPGQVCLSGAPQAAVAVGVPIMNLDITGMPAATGSLVSEATAAAEAAHGTGCGPPSLAELSILRT